MEIKNFLPFVGMVIVQVAMMGQLVAGKKAMLSGMTNFTFIFYSNAICSLILLPCCFLFQTSDRRHPMTYHVFSRCIMFGVLGFLVQIIGYTGIQFASPTLASSMLNLIPGFTFILAVIFRMEKVEFKSMSTQAKFIGIAISVLGAFVVTLYQGPRIIGIPSTSNSADLSVQLNNWIIGGLLMAIDCVFASFFLIAQALILKIYPALLIVTLFYSSVVAILSATLSLIIEKDLSSWSLQSNARILGVLYAGVFGAGFQVAVCSWCVQKRGPLFVAMFHPLGIVIATVMGVTLLGDSFYLGSLLGSIIIVIGFYSVIWGNSKDKKGVEENGISSPILQNNGEETVLLA